MASSNQEPTPQDVAAASLWTLPYLTVIAYIAATEPPSGAERDAADPLMKLLAPVGGPWLVVLLGAAGCAAWIWKARPKKEHLVRSLKWGVLASVGAVLGLLLVRAVLGARLPSFIPPEESAGPGWLLGLSAGTVEELLFRLVLLPLVFFGLRRRMGAVGAAVVAIAVTGLAFAASHELSLPGAFYVPFKPRIFLTRFIIPGAAMSVFFFRPTPAAVVAGHCAAHVVIPALFI